MTDLANVRKAIERFREDGRQGPIGVSRPRVHAIARLECPQGDRALPRGRPPGAYWGLCVGFVCDALECVMVSSV